MHHDTPTILREHITGLVLAGGQGSRMGGADKGLQLLADRPLAQWCAERLTPQVGTVVINANRHLDRYAALGLRVVPDLLPQDGDAPAAPSFAGPLAGFAAGLAACTTPWLLTVACDTPRFPTDLAVRLAAAAQQNNALIAMACTANGAGTPLPQPVFCLLHHSLAASVRAFLEGGGHKIRHWTQQHPCAMVVFDEADGADNQAESAFFNANTAQELAALEHWAQAMAHAPATGLRP